MPRKNLGDHVRKVLEGQGWAESSLIRDRLFDTMGSGVPSIRELNSYLRRDKKIISVYAPAGKTQIKKYAWKKN